MDDQSVNLVPLSNMRIVVAVSTGEIVKEWQPDAVNASRANHGRSTTFEKTLYAILSIDLSNNFTDCGFHVLE